MGFVLLGFKFFVGMMIRSRFIDKGKCWRGEIFRWERYFWREVRGYEVVFVVVVIVIGYWMW